MPRRNPKRLEAPPLVVPDLPPPQSVYVEEAAERAARDERGRQWREREDRREDAAVLALKECCWPNCHKPHIRTFLDQRPIPLCRGHSFAVWRRYVEDDDRVVLHAANEEARMRELRAEKRKAENAALKAACAYGQIYYIRLNDVIKIGWSSQLDVRLQDYTAGAELLAHHPGTRADERDLHRTFKIFRVHGREWYDGSTQILLDHISNMIDEWGPPQFEVYRNAKRTDQVTQLRARSGRR